VRASLFRDKAINQILEMRRKGLLDDDCLFGLVGDPLTEADSD
jgi:hypothetical protein